MGTRTRRTPKPRQMSEYNLSIDSDKTQSDTYYKSLREKGARIELREIRKKRTLDQNGWWHVLVTLFAIDQGYTKEQAKVHLKRRCDFMRYEFVNEHSGEVELFLRESKRLDTKEMSELIEWTYDYAAQLGCRLPTTEEYAKEKDKINAIIRSHRKFL